MRCRPRRRSESGFVCAAAPLNHAAVEDGERVGEFVVGHDHGTRAARTPARARRRRAPAPPDLEASADKGPRGFKRAVADPKRQHRAGAERRAALARRLVDGFEDQAQAGFEFFVEAVPACRGASEAAALLQRAHREAAVVGAEQRALALQRGLEHAPRGPTAAHVREGLLGVFELQVAAVVAVLQIERAILAEVRVLDLDHRDAIQCRRS